MYLATLMTMPLDIIFSLYKDFVIEARHGFNKKTLALFITDLIKVQVLTIVFGAPIGWGFFKLLSYERFILFCSIFYVSVAFLGISLFPHIIWPLFNKFEPITKDGVEEQVNALCETVGYPLK